MEPEICTKIMLRNLSEKNHISWEPNFLWLPHIVKIAHLNDALSELFELEASLVEGQSLQQKDKSRRKRKGQRCRSVSCLKILIFDTSKQKFVVKQDATGNGKKVMRSCCKCLFELIEANLTYFHPESLQNVSKLHFWQKALLVNGNDETKFFNRWITWW